MDNPKTEPRRVNVTCDFDIDKDATGPEALSATITVLGFLGQLVAALPLEAAVVAAVEKLDHNKTCEDCRTHPTFVDQEKVITTLHSWLPKLRSVFEEWPSLVTDIEKASGPRRAHGTNVDIDILKQIFGADNVVVMDLDELLGEEEEGGAKH